MHTNRFLKGLAVGAAGGALVLAGVAGTGTVASATPSQDATVNASPDRSDQANIYNLLQGDLKGKSGTWEGTGSVHGGWLQGPIGEMLVKDRNGTHSWPVKVDRLTPDILKLKILVGGEWNSGTLLGEVKNSRTTVYNGTLDSAGSDHIRITNFKVRSEFRGYNITAGSMTLTIGGQNYASRLKKGCLFRGKGSYEGTGPFFFSFKADLTAARGSITSSELAMHWAFTHPAIADGIEIDMTATGKDHVYKGLGTTAGDPPVPWLMLGLTLEKRTSTSPDCNWDTA